MAGMEEDWKSNGDVRKVVHRTVKMLRDDVKVGLVAGPKSPPTWQFYLGACGSVVWTIGSKLAVQLGDNNPMHAGPLRELERTLGDYPVDLVLWEQARPPKLHMLWTIRSGIKIMVWTQPTPGTWKPPEGWILSRRRLKHSQIGGVTDCSVTFYQVRRTTDTASPWLDEREHVSQTLDQVVDPTLGGRVAGIPVEGTVNTGSGILEWAQRFDRVTVPTVYHSQCWARRKLSPEELGAALDIPGHVRRILSRRQLAYLGERVLPGKLLAEAIMLLNMGHRSQGKRRQAGRETKEELRPVKKVKASPPIKPTPRIETNPQNPENDHEMTTVTAKAVKSDDAGVPEYLWNLRLMAALDRPKIGALRPKFQRALSVIRRFLLLYWKRKVEREFNAWFAKLRSTDTSATRNDFELSMEEIRVRGQEALVHVWRSSWWEWDGGSSILFWRWPLAYQKVALEGWPPMFVSMPPEVFEPQPPYTEAGLQDKVCRKVSKVVRKGYIVILSRDTPAHVMKSLMYMFDVEKGDNDIRMVYDGSKSGLNAALWAPWFSLPTVDTVCRSLLPRCWSGDNDYGEQFLNFPLHKKMQPYCGVDLSQLFPDAERNAVGLTLGVWKRNAMGLRPSPYACVQGALRAKRLILGDPQDPANPFHWARVELNLPGSNSYDCRLPWLILRRKDGSIATSLHQYIDDLRVSGASPELVWAASMRIGKICAWLGLQDAARKRREPSRTPGAWAGAVVSTDDANVYKTVTQDRWNKTRTRIRWLSAHVGLRDKWSLMDEDGTSLNPAELPIGGDPIPHKRAESIRGFLVYVSRTFPTMTPFLKGLHLTLDGWRPDRDEEGWRLHSEKGPLDQTEGDHSKAPKFVISVPRLKGDLDTLMELTAYAQPPKVPVRPSSVGTGYLVGDASGSGFGSTLWCAGDTHVGAEFGAWTKPTSKQSSNFREALNLVQRLESLVDSGRIAKGMELFVFTDNSTAERAFYNGTSRAKLLHELVIRLRKLEMRGEIFVHVIWIAGTRMIEQGTDGLSRGDLSSGVLNGKAFLEYVPLGRTVCERQPDFKEWLISHLPGNWQILSHEDWFHTAYQKPEGNYIWLPSPAIANAALEQMCEVMHVHPSSNHVFVTPSLFTALWRKQLRKATDLMISLPCGSAVWPASEHEPLTLGFACSLLPHSPWCFKRTRALVELQSEMSGMWRGSSINQPCNAAWHGRCYRQHAKDHFPVLAAQDVQDSLVDDSMMEEDDTERFKEARDGDHLMCTFQCDWCQFQNLKKRLPTMNDLQDEVLLLCLRRANLDALWARERSTVASNRREGVRYMKHMESLRIPDPYPSRGPWPVDDVHGVAVACALLLRSLDAGRNSSRIQFETMRKLRSHYSNFVHTTPQGMGAALISDDGSSGTLSNSPTNSLWFRRFMIGCHKRMGDVWIPDRPLILKELQLALTLLQEDWDIFKNDPGGRHKTALLAVALVAGFFAALRGEEIMRIDIGSTLAHWDESTNFDGAPHIPLMLAGRFKRELGEKLFCQPLAFTSKSGVDLLVWFSRALNSWSEAKVVTGPMFRVPGKGHQMKRGSVADLDPHFHQLLRRVQERWPRVIPEQVQIQDDYSLSRSLRRGATAEAQNAQIPKEVIEANNRWRKHTRAKGLTPGMSMMERYTDAKASVPALVRFSASL